MTLPSYWRQAAFSVAESADILAVPEDTLRTWMAREPSGQFVGAKTGGRIFLSGEVIFFYALVRDLSGHGVPVRTAMLAASGYAVGAEDAQPGEVLAIRNAAGKTNFHLTYEPKLDAATLVLPLHTMIRDLVERASAAYVREAA